MQLNIDQICEILPHRYPMLLVDKIIELVPMKYAIGTKCVSMNEPFFQGHFPKHPVMPGVLICEAMAQVGGVALMYPEENRNLIPMFTTKATILKTVGRMGKVHCEGTVNGAIAAEADFLFYLAESTTDSSKK